MALQSQKGLKPFVIRYLALVIGFCYLAHPLHQQISTVFHEISHFIESPPNVLSHKTNSAHNEDHSTDHHDFHAHNTNEKIQNGLVLDHQHALMDLITSLFEDSDRDDPDSDPFLILIKYDKHISALNGTFTPIKPAYPNRAFLTTNRHTEMLYLTVPSEPPQPLLPAL